MSSTSFIYTFNYDPSESDLCKLETKHVFNKIEEHKLLLSDRKVDPSHSAYIKSRIDVSSFSEDYSTLIQQINEQQISIEGFKVEYVVLYGDTTEYPDRLKKLKDVGFSILSYPDYYKPTITFALCFFEGIWYFGTLIKNSFDWHKHKSKPCSYSNSISIRIAKALVNIASKANQGTTLLDACCGVGTILLEACFAGHSIEGCEINFKVFMNAQINLSHFNYTATLHHSDIKDLHQTYDAAVIDLPYNLLSTASDEDILNIIESAAKLSNRLVIVSLSDISEVIKQVGFEIIDYCTVDKDAKSRFIRKIWVCEKSNS